MGKLYIPTYLFTRRSHPNLIVPVLASAEPRRVINIKWVWCGSSHGQHIYNLDRSSLAGLGDYETYEPETSEDFNAGINLKRPQRQGLQSEYAKRGEGRKDDAAQRQTAGAPAERH